jgi:hypothetical protein
LITPALGKVLGDLDGTAAPLITNFVPNPATAGNAEKPQFAFAGFAPQED